MATKHAKFLALAAVLAGCGDIARDAPPPTDRFRFPIGLALRHLQAPCARTPGQACSCAAGSPGCDTLLHVVSSNFDLTYDTNEGGTLIALRVPAPEPVGQPRAARECPGAIGADGICRVPDIGQAAVGRGAARIGSFGGEVALLDEATCPGWERQRAGAPAAFVASRSRDRLYRLTLGDDGSVTCGAGCRTGLDPDLRDPFGLALACRGSPPDVELFTTYLTTPANIGFISRLVVTPSSTDLAQQINVGVSSAHTAQFDAAGDRLFLTGRFVGPGYMPFRWLELAYPIAPENLPPPIDLATRVYGAETTGFSLSSDGTRAYLGLRLYDGYTSAAVGVRTPDIGGALAVLDMRPSPVGGPSGTLLRLVPVGKGPSEVKVVRRPGLADLVAVTCTEDNQLWLYDDADGSVPRIFSSDPASGSPVLGKQPSGLAVESGRADGRARIFVGSFASHFVSVIRLDDPADPRSAWIEAQLGMAQ